MATIERPWTGEIYPVFVTSKVPLDVINDCLVESARYAESWEMEDVLGLFIVADPLGARPSRPTRGPITAFTAPSALAGAPVSALRDLFLKRWARGSSPDQNHMSSTTFAVLDLETVQSKTALLVSLLGDRIDTARCELSMVSQLLNGPEQGSLPLSPDDWGQYRENGVMVYRRSWYDRLFPDLSL